MSEIWLRTNRRALAFGLILPDVLLTVGVLVAVFSENSYVRAAGLTLAGVGGLGALGIVWLMCQPRLAYADGYLLVYVRRGPPYRVPIEVVEGFLLGQGPTMLPGARHPQAETTTVVVRLADAASEWSERETKPALAKWCGGYITLRGTWCEPLNVDRVQQLNARLAEVNGPGGSR